MSLPGLTDGPLASLRRGRVWKILAAVALAPPIAWISIVSLLPMEWARTRLVAAISESTGRPVHIASVRIAPLGGLHVEGLEIAERGREDSPWLRIQRLSIDVNPLRLASGCTAVSEVHADGLDLKIRRRGDGSVDLADLFKAKPRPKDAGSAGEGEDVEVLFRVERSRVAIIDEMTDNHLELLQVRAEGTAQRLSARLASLRAQVNGGLVDLSAGLDRGPSGPAFEGQLHAKGVRLGTGMAALGYLLPILSDAPVSANLDGRFELDLYLQGRGSTTMELGRSLAGRGAIAVEPISLDRSEFVAELARAAKIPARDRVGSVRSNFEIGGGKVSSRDLTLKLAGVPIVLAGWTDFLGRLDYQVRADGIASKIAREARGLLDDLPIDPDHLASLRVQGTLDRLVWTLDGVPITGKAGESSPNVEEKVRLIGRRLRERYQR